MTHSCVGTNPLLPIPPRRSCSSSSSSSRFSCSASVAASSAAAAPSGGGAKPSRSFPRAFSLRITGGTVGVGCGVGGAAGEAGAGKDCSDAVRGSVVSPLLTGNGSGGVVVEGRCVPFLERSSVSRASDRLSSAGSKCNFSEDAALSLRRWLGHASTGEGDALLREAAFSAARERAFWTRRTSWRPVRRVKVARN